MGPLPSDVVRMSTSLDKNNSGVNNVRHMGVFSRTPSLPQAHSGMVSAKRMLVSLTNKCKR